MPPANRRPYGTQPISCLVEPRAFWNLIWRVKLNRAFDLIANGETTMLLDFDGDTSIKETDDGRYIMTPVIGVVSVQ